MLTLTTEVFNAIPLDKRIELIRLEKRAPTFLTPEDYELLEEVVQAMKDGGIQGFEERFLSPP